MPFFIKHKISYAKSKKSPNMGFFLIVINGNDILQFVSYGILEN